VIKRLTGFFIEFCPGTFHHRQPIPHGSKDYHLILGGMRAKKLSKNIFDGKR
jgi:hypothetical protein